MWDVRTSQLAIAIVRPINLTSAVCVVEAILQVVQILTPATTTVKLHATTIRAFTQALDCETCVEGIIVITMPMAMVFAMPMKLRAAPIQMRATVFFTDTNNSLCVYADAACAFCIAGNVFVFDVDGDGVCNNEEVPDALIRRRATSMHQQQTTMAAVFNPMNVAFAVDRAFPLATAIVLETSLTPSEMWRSMRG